MLMCDIYSNVAILTYYYLNMVNSKFRHTARQEEMVADDDGQEAGPSGIGKPQSALSGASVVAQMRRMRRGKYFCKLLSICSCLFSSYVQQYWCFIHVY